MLTSNRGTLRHPKFSECAAALVSRMPTAQQIIDAAVWEIERNPTGIGVHIGELDIWQARLIMPLPPELLLMYCFNVRFVTMLTIIAADGSPI